MPVKKTETSDEKKASTAKKTAPKKSTKDTKKTAAKTPAKKKVAKKAAPKKVVRVPKKEVISSYQSHGKDTGSAPVQVAILTERVRSLTDHLKDHPKDNHSRRGLLMMVAKRRKLLNYLKRVSKDEYQELVKKLEIRG